MTIRASLPDPSPISGNPHHAEVLVLNCMDFRLIGAVSDYLKSRGLEGKYDQITLAGGAIGVMSDQTEPWANTFWQHVALARKLHGIRKIIIIDHRDCGACKAFVSPDCADQRDRETAIHTQWMKALAREITNREPNLEIELLLMDLDGTVEPVAR